ncbi:type B DNA-directed DNA polymerase [Halopelagius longus]|uniref:DNA-directed DNA polymerase n=1 Tax=Halopelagius longus TaxID=1236180 RepID=A0A1H0Z684_9EURY|nr:type B DNA-directed DNA polymerase [Halopelagius longus]RDI72853.1 type B DNA-directed DNA polymerase [Halopelagius longus]SDQ22965.1 DNA polymerase I [Halopelagius longus]
MPFAFDFDDGAVVEWSKTPDGVESRRVTDYAPAMYLAGPEEALESLESPVAARGDVAAVSWDRKFTGLDADERALVLRIEAKDPRGVPALAGGVRESLLADLPPGRVRAYDVDLAPGFRYCLDTGASPAPAEPLETVRFDLPEKALADGDLSALSVDGSEAATERDALDVAAARLDERDPDVLVVSDAGVLSLLAERAVDFGADVPLGRRPGLERLAGENTVESYGRVLHSPARYAVPGRAVVDVGSSFLWAESRLDGLLYLVERSWRPLSEAAWASIGTVLTSMQTREARARDVLVPWNKRRPESFKSVETLHAADRGGFTFDPEVGLHENVVEVDFASLYPRIICEYNVSPDTVLCDCHAGRSDVPELGYNVCDERGFLADVLEPLLEDRRDLKDEARAAEAAGDEERAAAARHRAGAIKWVLVSCFGYQGYRNAKFGRIECHEAINAVARDLLLRAKETAEEAGWRVVHGIVDSLWVTRDAADADPPEEIAARVSEAADVPLEVEDAYEWVCFVPKRGSNRGALTRYFGKVADRDEYKVRGIEARQRSTPAFVEEVQRELIEAVGRHRAPEPVCDRLARHRARLRRGDVSAEELARTARVSRPAGEYRRDTLVAAAVRRAERRGLSRAPGQDVRYVVTDADGDGIDRVRLDFEAPSDYDAAFYDDALLRAAESVLSPFGWDRGRIRRYLRPGRDATLAAFE